MATNGTGNGSNEKCAGINTRGLPCESNSMTGSDFCFTHNPDTREQHRAASSRGGRGRHGRKIGTIAEQSAVAAKLLEGGVRIQTTQDVLSLLEIAVSDVLSLEPSISRARALGALAGEAAKALKDSEFEARIRALEDDDSQEFEDQRR